MIRVENTKRAFFFLLCFVLCIDINSQIASEKSKDSLLTRLKSLTNSQERIKTLSILVETEQDDKIWPKYNEEIIAIAEQNIKETGQPKSALDTFYYQKLSSAIGDRGFLFYMQGNYKKAVDDYNLSIKIGNKVDNKNNAAIMYNNIAGVYMDQNLNDNALVFFNKSLALYAQIGNEDGTAQCYANIASIYDARGRQDTALEFYNKALKIHERHNNFERIAVIYNNFGTIYSRNKDYGKAIDYLKKSLDMQQQVQNKKGVTFALANIAEVLMRQNKYAEAKTYLLKAYKLAEEMRSPLSIRAPAISLYKVESKLGNWQEALKYYKIYVAAQDSIHSLQNAKTAIEEKIRFDYEKQKAVDQAVHDQEMVVAAEREQKQRIISISVAIGLILMITFAVFVFIRLRISNNQNKIIEKQKQTVEEKNSLIEEKQKEIIDSITYAKRIQNTLLAHEEYLNEHLPEHFVLFKPKDIVSGDFYWASKKENRFYLAVCDSTGHGVPGAFMSLLNISFLNEAINEKNIAKPNQILDHVRNRLIENISKDGGQDGMDAVLLCIEENNITYAGANNSVVVISNNEIRSLEADKMPVGKGEKDAPFTLRTVNAKKGDCIYLYTDGYADQFGGPKGKKFKYRPLNELFLSINAKALHEQKKILETTFIDWKKGLEQVDDVCVIGIKI